MSLELQYETTTYLLFNFLALADNRVSRIYLIPSLIKNMLEVMKETNQMLPNLTHWESTGEALTYEIAKSFFHFFEDKKVGSVILMYKT